MSSRLLYDNAEESSGASCRNVMISTGRLCGGAGLPVRL